MAGVPSCILYLLGCRKSGRVHNNNNTPAVNFKQKNGFMKTYLLLKEMVGVKNGKGTKLRKLLINLVITTEVCV